MFAGRKLTPRQEAVSVLRPSRRLGRRQILHSLTEVHDALLALTDGMERQGFSHKDIFSVRLCVEEALVNSIHHGHHRDPSKRVRMRFLVTPQAVLVKITDQGDGFDPRQVPDPREAECLEKASGRGLLLMNSFMTGVWFNRRGNSVTLFKAK
jgi:serine/threonine-protein kinase RsbW